MNNIPDVPLLPVRWQLHTPVVALTANLEVVNIKQSFLLAQLDNQWELFSEETLLDLKMLMLEWYIKLFRP
jgi:hypothetical protein